MSSIERREHVRHSGLHPDRQPVHAGIHQRPHDLVGHGVGVRLNGHLGAVADAEGSHRGVEHPPEIACRQQ